VLAELPFQNMFSEGLRRRDYHGRGETLKESLIHRTPSGPD
jgi:hypothetical protein